MKAAIIVKNAIRCKRCGDVIESISVHDFIHCSCGACAVDGGRDYLRRCGYPDDYEDLSEYKEVEVTPKYKVGDVVTFNYYGDVMKGTIQDFYTFPNSTIIECVILEPKEPRLYKCIEESQIISKF